MRNGRSSAISPSRRGWAIAFWTAPSQPATCTGAGGRPMIFIRLPWLSLISTPRQRLRHCFIMPRRPENGQEPSFGASKTTARVQLFGMRPVLTGVPGFRQGFAPMTLPVKNSPTEREGFSQRISSVHLDYRHCLSDRLEIVPTPEESCRSSKSRGLPRTNRRSHFRRRIERLVESRFEPPADGTTADFGTRLPHGSFIRGNCGDHRLPGWHGEGAHVSCARKVASISACLERCTSRLVGQNRLTHNRRIENSAEHHEVSALLPWYVNETLGEIDRQRVDAHLGMCTACREDLAAQRRICEAIDAQPAIDYMPVASLKRLQARLDALGESDPTIAPVKEQPPQRVPWRGWMAASVAAVAVAVALLAANRFVQTDARLMQPNYRTVTNSAPRPQGEVIRAVFAPSITLVELQSILDEAQT